MQAWCERPPGLTSLPSLAVDDSEAREGDVVRTLGHVAAWSAGCGGAVAHRAKYDVAGAPHSSLDGSVACGVPSREPPKWYAGGRMCVALDDDVDDADCHDSRDDRGETEGDVGGEGAEACAFSMSARRQACEQYGPVEALSQAKQKSWKQSMLGVLSCGVSCEEE